MTTTAEGAAGAAAHSSHVFRTPLGVRLFSVIGTGILILATAFMIVAAGFGFTLQWALGLFMMAMAGFMGALTGYVGRDLRGKLGLRVALGADAVTLDLPKGRSLIHRPPAQHLTIPYADIAAIESRYEAYGSLGMEMMQRAYVLRRKGGDLIFLFEERALATGMASTMFASIVAELATRAGVTIHELGTVEGKGGFLGVWGTHAPDWAAPPLPRQRAMRLWRHAAFTGSLAIAIIIVALAIRLLAGG
jgi:hypothetical protein